MADKYLVVFDLDACCWYPEMYQLWGGGAPFVQNSVEPNNTLTDTRKTTVRLLKDVAACWAECHRRMQAGEPLVVGVASRSDEPSWARECLRKFVVSTGVSMMDIVTENLAEIYKGSKRDHFAALQQKTGIPYKRMCFFDDDMTNIRDVGGLGVHCVYTPDGVTRPLFVQGVNAACAGADVWEAFGKLS
uniref:Magnesium-dependent phosphatase-1 n=1 Tax=Haptolina brevifila TaxID=156173 RepID=A0A7S2JFT4_9EUKA|mmetsp:Transcript_81150/g.161419  ORF Transcript_81150/g.161419 Transcript_81150/m.161419 type:complete len:189 (+) Transcript_81150:138-704(+)